MKTMDLHSLNSIIDPRPYHNYKDVKESRPRSRLHSRDRSKDRSRSSHQSRSPSKKSYMALSIITKACEFWFKFPWRFLHFMITLWLLAMHVVEDIESYIISTISLLASFQSLNLSNLKYLTIVVESDDAYQTSKVIKLLKWLNAMGVKHVSLYDIEGVLKKSKYAILEKTNARLWVECGKSKSFMDGKLFTLEFLSLSDGKEAVVNAANFLMKNYNRSRFDSQSEHPTFTESDVTEALRAIGCDGPEPQLMLIYGPVRCHMGFPAWRMRYTEIMHVGTLNSMSYGSLIKVMRKFAIVRQNYGR